MKKLPVIYKNQLNGECWTFYKLAILQTSPVAIPWLMSHMEFYINENMCGGYGDSDCSFYHMRYFSDILSMNRIPIVDVDKYSIVSVISDKISEGQYVILYLNLNKLLSREGMLIHELMIYGYDVEREVFASSMLIDGSFKEVEISYSIIMEAYDDARCVFMNDGWRLLVKRSYYYGITSIRIRNDYRNDNWIADYIDKIDHELHGKQIIQYDLGSPNIDERICYTGSACLVAIVGFLENEHISDRSLWRIVRTLKMMYDYRSLFVLSIEWFVQMVNGGHNKALITILKEYKNCADSVQCCYLLLCKYMQTKDIHLIETIKDILYGLHQKERSILSDYRELIWPYYYEMNGVPMPPEDD